MKNKFIVLEGLDGAGKTSIAKYLAKTDGFKGVSTPDTAFKPIRDYIDGQDVYTKLLFYYASNFDMSHKIEKYLKESSVICDRYFYSTLVYFAYFSGYSIKESLKLMEGLTDKLCLPDVVVYLTVSDELRINRLKERAKEVQIPLSSTDAYFIKNMNRCYLMERLYLELMELMNERIKHIVINAEHSVDVTCKSIMDEVKSMV